jgi:hypothetical protein
MKLEEVYDLLEEHSRVCGTHKLLVQLKRPTKEGYIEGYIFEGGYGAGNENELEFDPDSDDWEIPVENVYCPYCCEVIYKAER